jgi:hypothetical protein
MHIDHPLFAVRDRVVRTHSNKCCSLLHHDDFKAKKAIETMKIYELVLLFLFRLPSSLSHNSVCKTFAVHSRETVTFDGGLTTIYSGDVGVSPGTAVTGTPNFEEQGQIVADSSVFAAGVLTDHAAAMAVRSESMAIEMGGETFYPGTYRSGSFINIAYGTVVTLDGNGDQDATFLFQAVSTLVTGEDTSFNLINGANAENVLWALGTTATLGANSVLEGSILAGTAIEFGTNSELHGCALAQSAVTFASEGSVYLDGPYPSATDPPASSAAETLSRDTVCGRFAVQAGTAITFADANTIAGGDVGFGTAITGTPVLEEDAALGTITSSDMTTTAKHAAAMAEQTGGLTSFAGEIGGRTFYPGTYRSIVGVTTAAVTVVTLDGDGDPNAKFLFQASTLSTAAGTKIVLINGAKAENVFWAVKTAATLGANSVLEGSIITGTSITFGAGAIVRGCMVAVTSMTFGIASSITEEIAASDAANTIQPSTLSRDTVCGRFAVQAGTAITFADANTIAGGDVGFGTAITGTPVLEEDAALGTITSSDMTTTAKHAAAMAEQTGGLTSFAGEIGGRTFYPGTYRSIVGVTTAAVTVVTLDGDGDPNAKFLFQASTLSTAAGTKIVLINGAKAENVFWAVKTAATLGANSVLEGSIITGTSITFGAGAIVRGCMVAVTSMTFGIASSITEEIAAPDAANTIQPFTLSHESVCGNFAVHAGTTITFDGGLTTIDEGDIGVSPINAITGTPDFQGQGQIVADSTVFAAGVLTDHAAAMAVRSESMAIEIGGETFYPGTYRSDSFINIAYGTQVHLDAQGDQNAKFLFQAVSNLSTGAGSEIVLIDGAKAENVLWALGTAATLGAFSVLEGSIIAGTSITLGQRSELNGCAIAKAAVTFESAGHVEHPGN